VEEFAELGNAPRGSTEMGYFLTVQASIRWLRMIFSRELLVMKLIEHFTVYNLQSITWSEAYTCIVRVYAVLCIRMRYRKDLRGFGTR
jgi:hypothetical protein